MHIGHKLEYCIQARRPDCKDIPSMHFRKVGNRLRNENRSSASTLLELVWHPNLNPIPNPEHWCSVYGIEASIKQQQSLYQYGIGMLHCVQMTD